MKREIDKEFFTRVLNNGPVGLIGSAANGKENGMSVAWMVPVSKEPPRIAVYISPNHLSWDLIKDGGDFSINIPGKDMLKYLGFLGGVSGHKIDKLKICGIDKMKGKEIQSPIFPQALANLECELVSMDLETHAVIGEIKYCLIEEECFYDHWKFDKSIYPLQHLGGSYYQCGSEEFVQPRFKQWKN